MFRASLFTKRTLAVTLCFVATSVVGCIQQKPKAGIETKGRPKRWEGSVPNNSSGSATSLGSKTACAHSLSNDAARKCFISQVMANQEALRLDCTKYSDGVSLVVLAKNEHNEMCVILGKEKGGRYADRFNFIGGKMDKAQGTPEEKLVGTLYDEVREELGIHLNFSAFERSLIFIRPPKGNRYKTMMCFCYLSGIDTKKWEKMYQERLKRSLKWKYVEMSEIAYVPVSNIQNNSISRYVKDNIALIEEAVGEIREKNMTPVYRSAFTKMDDRVPMLE